MKKIIIIGSGIGGLVAGNLLAREGHSVTIFESHGMPGGYTAGFHRKGYYFESGTVALEASATIFQVMKEIGVLDQIDFEKIGTRFVSGDFDVTPSCYREFKKSVYNHYCEKETLDRFFYGIDEIVSAAAIIDKPLPYVLKGIGMAASILESMAKVPKLMRLDKRYGNLTSSELAAGYFKKDSELYKLFSGFGYPDMSAMAVGSALDGLFAGLWTVKSGMQSWADILSGNFRKIGGEIRLRTRVDKIVTRDGSAEGVLCGKDFFEADYVIAACDYKKTLLDLIDDKSLIPAELQTRLGNAAVSESYFTVYMGLKMTNKELCRYMKIPHVHVFSKPGADFDDSCDGEFFRKSSVEMFSPSLVNPKLAPEGKSSLMLQTKAPRLWMGNWGAGNRETYLQIKEKAMRDMIKNASGLIPHLEEVTDYQEAATPLTYERFTGNSEGASMGWSPNPKKAFLKNLTGVNIETPVKNLLIGSCWAMQMGGIPGAVCAAYQCAKKIR